MAYFSTKLDGNYNPVYDAVSAWVPVRVPANAVGVVSVPIPKGAFTVGFKRCNPDTKVEASVNGKDFFPVDEGDYYGKYLNLITELKLDIKVAVSDEIVLLFAV